MRLYWISLVLMLWMSGCDRKASPQKNRTPKLRQSQIVYIFLDISNI
jgi:hypothetical protein